MSESLKEEEATKESATVPVCPEYDDGIYQHCFDSFPIPGLCTNFFTAATLLRLVRQELHIGLIQDGAEVVENFYTVLESVEKYITRRDSRTSTSTNCNKFIIEIEGLDGSGKTTLCQSLTRQINETDTNANTSVAIATTKTPSACLKKIRPLFDHRGGILARVFYTISNYILEYEIYNMNEDIQVVIVDRWYAGTFAYMVAYRGEDTNDDDAPDIDGMDNSVFAWPQDLKMRPNILLILNIDPEVRISRLAKRKANTSGVSLYNPWDDRLGRDLQLGPRILFALSRMYCDGMLVKGVDANRTVEEVLLQAAEIVKPEYGIFNKLSWKSQMRSESNDPLEEWVFDAQRLNLCDRDGKRHHHALWNFQVAYSEGVNTIERKDYCRASVSTSTPPVMKTVRLDRIIGEFIYYWTSNTELLVASDSGNGIRMSSSIWTAGSYPMEFQWRAEGFVTKVTNAECKLWGFHPPNSSVAHTKACHGPNVTISKNNFNIDDSHRPVRIGKYEEAVALARESSNGNDGDDDGSSLCMTRFVPLRVEVLRGGPNARGVDGYLQRSEWIRSTIDHSENSSDENGGWSSMSIPPSTTRVYQHVPTRVRYIARPICLALTGCHAAGKSTIGKRLAAILGWRFHPELGEVLRENEYFRPRGHYCGDGSRSWNDAENRDAWDDLIFDAEKRRDEDCLEARYCRVVETWHVGNSKWFSARRRNKSDDPNINIQRYTKAVLEHKKSAVAILVHLDIPSSTVMLNRRMHDESTRARIPLDEEVKECEEMYQALQSNTAKDRHEICSWGIPSLRVDNGEFGDEAMTQTIQTIISFIQQHYYKRALPL